MQQERKGGPDDEAAGPVAADRDTELGYEWLVTLVRSFDRVFTATDICDQRMKKFLLESLESVTGGASDRTTREMFDKFIFYQMSSYFFMKSAKNGG